MQDVLDSLTTEEPLLINVNGKPFTVTMRTPGDDRDLVRGLLFSEGIFTGNDEDFDYQESKQPDTDVTYAVNFLIHNGAVEVDITNRRSMLSVSACGICGKKELPDLAILGERLETTERFAVENLSSMFAVMEEKQSTFHETGGSHAAAAFALDGEFLCLKEDIGRHNAVDKVIGDLLFQNRIEAAGALLISGRVSYEIVTKAFTARIPILAAISAPSSLAVHTAETLGITLIAFCRNHKATVYSHLSRISEKSE